MSIQDPLAWLEGQAPEWILAQRAVYRPRAVPIPPAAHEILEPFFGQDVLDRTRCCAVARIEDPPLLAAAVGLRVPQTIDFTQMAGITFRTRSC